MISLWRYEFDHSGGTADFDYRALGFRAPPTWEQVRAALLCALI